MVSILQLTGFVLLVFLLSITSRLSFLMAFLLLLMLPLPFADSAQYYEVVVNWLHFLLSELNRFTINSINHNHYSDAGRIALSDDTNSLGGYWLRTAGMGGTPVASVSTAGLRSAHVAATSPFRGIRPILWSSSQLTTLPLIRTKPLYHQFN